MNKKIKIALLSDEIAPGSMPKLMGQPVRALKKIGLDCEVIMIIDKGYWQKHKEHFDFHLQGIKIRYLFPFFPAWVRKCNFKLPGMSFFSLHHIASWFWAHRAIKKNEFDMIIAYCQYTSLSAENIKRYCGIPYLFLVWDPSTFTARKIYKNRFGWKFPILYFFARMLDLLAVIGPRAIITSGKFHHDYFRQITNKPLEILAPGCFPEEKLPDFSQRERTILTYDRWDIGNIPNIFLDILEKLGQKDVTLTIGGFWHPDYLLKGFQAEVEKRGLSSRVKLLGPLDEKMIIDLCSKAMVHVHPVHEAFGMQSLEAAACGCPIIIPEGSGVTDLFEQGIQGYFPQAGNLDEMIGYINKIFADRQKTEQMSRAAWEKAKDYTWEGYSKKLAKICRRYINETI